MQMSLNVMVIPARKAVESRGLTGERPKLRVAAYCRVSTDYEEQASSYEAQIRHYRESLQSHPDWEPAGIFADDGISGTDTKKREQFNRMIDECMAGKIQMIMTKSISRFARNTLDCLQYIRLLKERNIAVFFEKENINTLDAKGEVLLTIMASLAQQESLSLSQNVKLGLQYRYQQGEVQVNCRHFLGYTRLVSLRIFIIWIVVSFSSTSSLCAEFSMPLKLMPDYLTPRFIGCRPQQPTRRFFNETGRSFCEEKKCQTGIVCIQENG
jgi:site-specific DNA recombinase